MSKNLKKQEPVRSENRSRQELERENELLRLENAYLKKLKAFQKNPDAFLKKYKQYWHTNLKRRIQTKGYSTSGGYSGSSVSLSREAIKKSENDQPLKEQIEHFIFEFKERYEYKSITEELKKLGYVCDRINVQNFAALKCRVLQ